MWHASPLVVRELKVGFEQHLAFLVRGGLAVERDGGEERRDHASDVVGNLFAVWPTDSLKIAVKMCESIEFGPIKIGALKETPGATCAVESRTNKI